MREAHASPAGARPSGTIDDPLAALGQVSEGAVDVRDSEREVVDALAPVREKLRDGRLRVQRFEELDVGRVGLEKGHADSVRSHFLGRARRRT